MKKILPHDFPSLLRQIPDPPKELYLQGEYPDETEFKFLAVVGSRAYSEYGKAVCEKIIRGLQGYSVVIVSGLALGIDSIAHRAALEAKLPTIAIPGSGLSRETLYPRSHQALAAKILEANGALLSPFAPNFHATPYSFPERNRIMAGISHAILVIEAELRSGTLITARLATDYNRDVLAIPHGIFSKTGEGPHLLLKLGATPIRTSEEVLEALHIENHSASALKNYDHCSPEELEVIRILEAHPVGKEHLVLILKKPIDQINTLLSLMEIKGIIIESGGEIRLT